MSPQQAHRIMESAWKDGLEHRDVEAFRNMGSRGTWRRNVWRDILLKTKVPMLMNALSRISAPFQIPGERIEDGELAVLYPHALFSYMHHNHREQFDRRMCGGDRANVSKFWDSMSEHPAYDSHPMLTHPRFNFHEYGVAYGVHGDGVTTLGCGKVWARSAECISWASCLATSNASWVQNFVIALVFKLLLVGGETGATMQVLWQHICWSLY